MSGYNLLIIWLSKTHFQLMFMWPCITSTMMSATNKMQQFFCLLIFLLIFLNQPNMFRATNSPILRSTFLTVYTAFGTMHRHCCRLVPQCGTGRQQQIRPSSGALLLTVYTAFGTMRRHCFQPLRRLRWNWFSIWTVAPVGSSVGALYQKLYIQLKKYSWGWANLSLETCRADLKRLINEKVIASFLLAYIIIFEVHLLERMFN